MRQCLPKPALLGTMAAALLTLAACGNGRDTATVQPSGAPSAPHTKLTVTVRQSPSAKPQTWTLTCGPTGGTLPRATSACAVLDKSTASHTDPFAPTPKGQMCTMIFGGPQTARVTGTWNGKKVDASFNRRNGCEMKRWTTLSAMLGSPTLGR
jgi:hypothetical protein